LRKVNIGTTGISVTELCHGTLIMGGLQANLTPEEGAVAIRKSFEMGVNFYDTAKGYGTYPHLALGLQGIARDRLVIASKSHASSYEEMKADVDECMRELSLERVDIFHLHLLPSIDELNARRGALDCLVEYKNRGLVGAIGASTHTVAGVQAINTEPAFDVVFPVLNKNGLGIIDGNLDDMLEALRQSKQQGKFVYAMKPIGGGHLHDEVEESLNYLRELPVCDAVAVGMKDEAEVEMNVTIFNDLPVGDDLRQRVHSVARRLIVYDRCIGCGLCVDECDQGAITIVNDKAVVDDSKCILCGYCAAVCPEYVIRVI
jgi:predicted aldo/keto reductase-like oxidoreductase